MQNYQDWADRHDKIVDKAKKMIEQFRFKVIVMEEGRKPKFLRIRFGSKKIDFQVKEVKTKFVRSIWLCKKDKFNKTNLYILYASKEKSFSIATGNDIDRNHELKDSEWDKSVKYMVVDISIFRPAKTFFKTMKTRYEGELQRRINDWI